MVQFHGLATKFSLVTMHWYNNHKAGLTLAERLADRVTKWTGSFTAFTTSVMIVLIWGMLGPVFQYSDTWQLVINTGTTIVTFLMVFLIQNNQNRQENRDRHQAEVDFATTVAAKQEIEALALELSRIEVEKLDAIIKKLS